MSPWLPHVQFTSLQSISRGERCGYVTSSNTEKDSKPVISITAIIINRVTLNGTIISAVKLPLYVQLFLKGYLSLGLTTLLQGNGHFLWKIFATKKNTHK